MNFLQNQVFLPIRHNMITRKDIVGNRIADIRTCQSVLADGFVNNRCFVRIGEQWIELDSKGVDECEPLNWLNPALVAPDSARILDELIGKTITETVVSDYLPTFAFVLECDLLLHCSDLGPPFNSFGPLVVKIGDFYKRSDLLDYWTREGLD